ncbi:MAG: molybdopterin-guanine dinucleotide biosynthesis protein B, partial [Oceanospirillaceae bacterium]|nr:molybdopterin-guanine dinucleotide biosynthesis protein B [Oceanospirillaceae bacterium]
MKVFGVVGWKNNGKTTLVERLISQLTSMGYKVSSVKHAHHNVDIDEPGRDSYRHRAAGAKQTLLATQHRWALMREHREQDPPNLEQLLPLFEPCDIVIVEGYKGAAHPKLEIIRHLNKEGLLADQMPNIVALVTDQPHLPSDLPQLDLNNIQQITDFVLQHTGLVTTPAVHEVNDCYSPAQQLQTAETVWQGMQALASTQVKSQTLALDQCMNRRLAEALTTPYDSPRFDNAAVDGYAFNCNDLIQQPDATLPLMATEANAGGSEKLSLKQGYCMRVLTGAQMPKGANTVVMQEDVHLTNDSVTFPSHYKAHSNWRPQGEDVKAGEVIINQGQLIRPQDIGLAAAVGQAQLRVYNKVRVALFSTGNEVYELGQELPEDGIYDVNRYLLKALLTSLHCEVTDLGILADDFSTIRTALDSASQDHQLI